MRVIFISPFSFQSRSFASQGDNIPDPLVPDETLLVSYDYYQGREDKLFLDNNINFETQVYKGHDHDPVDFGKRFIPAIEFLL